MRKLSLFLVGVLIAVVLAPITFAKSQYPIYIKDIEIYTRTGNQGIAGEMTVCSNKAGRTKFSVKIENSTVKALYKRNMLTISNECRTFDLHFNEKFSLMSKAGDEVEFELWDVKTSTGEKYRKAGSYVTVIEDRSESEDPCGDVEGDDDIYAVCTGDFITHTPTGVRIKVISYDGRRIDLAVTGIKWGGVKKVRIYKEKFKEVTAADLTKLQLTYFGSSSDDSIVLGVNEA